MLSSHTIDARIDTSSLVRFNAFAFSSRSDVQNLSYSFAIRSINSSGVFVQYTSYVLGNIKDKSILESLENNSTLTTVINDTIPNECNECLLKEKCRGGVADRRYLWGGSLECRDPYCISPVVTKIEPIITEERKDFSSVHDGYLPTMFFRP